MLGEIFLLRMEAIYRASEESAPAGNSRSSLSGCRVQRGFCSWVGMELFFQMMLGK
jgi:hypothetical protein